MRLLLALLLSLLPALGLAAPLSFTIGTSEPVVVDTTGGTPLIWLNFGGGEVRAATYRSGSGTAALEFAYDIAAGDFAPAGIIAAGQVELAGGAIRDLAGNPLTLSFTPPDLSGVRVRTYRPVWTTDPITADNASAAAFEITKAPLGATFDWEITSDGGGSASGSGTISAAPHPVAGLDLSALGDGTLTLSLTLTTAAGTSAPRTVAVAKTSVIDCTDPAVLDAASPGARCADGSVYAGALAGNHRITTVSGCGYEPSGNSTTKAGSSFTPTCSGGADNIAKRWADSTGANEGATSLTDGLANTNQLIADAQRLNPAAAYCYHLDLHGKTDWYLPARDELSVLYANRGSIGGFDGAHWSSSEQSSTSSWRRGFNDGSLFAYGKTSVNRIRCIRTLTPAPAVPSGYGVAFTSDPVNAGNAGAAAFQFSGAEVGAGYSYTITSSGGAGSVQGAGSVASATQSVTGLNLAGLPDGTLTLSVVLTNGGGSGAAASDGVAKDATAPAGYAVAFTTDPVDAGNAGAGAFQFSGAEVGAAFAYTITSDGGAGSVTGSGTIASATQSITGLDLTALPDGTLTVSVTLTDAAGNAGAAASDTVAKETGPAIFAVAWVTSPEITGTAYGSFRIEHGIDGAEGLYTITSSGGPGSVSGRLEHEDPFPITVTNIYLGDLPDGTLTLSYGHLDEDEEEVVEPVVTATIGKTTLDCTDAAVLAAASPGARCQDGAIFAGVIDGSYRLTHRTGCRQEPLGTDSSAPTSDFTPGCTFVFDVNYKVWSNPGGFDEGANDTSDGALNTQALMTDAQAINPAAAYCHHLVLNGRSDWYLPAFNEMTLLWTNRSTIGGFSSADYWTSTQSSLNALANARTRHMSLGTTPDSAKTVALRLRCMHAAP